MKDFSKIFHEVSYSLLFRHYLFPFLLSIVSSNSNYVSFEKWANFYHELLSQHYLIYFPLQLYYLYGGGPFTIEASSFKVQFLSIVSSMSKLLPSDYAPLVPLTRSSACAKEAAEQFVDTIFQNQCYLKKEQFIEQVQPHCSNPVLTSFLLLLRNEFYRLESNLLHYHSSQGIDQGTNKYPIGSHNKITDSFNGIDHSVDNTHNLLNSINYSSNHFFNSEHTIHNCFVHHFNITTHTEKNGHHFLSDNSESENFEINPNESFFDGDFSLEQSKKEFLTQSKELLNQSHLEITQKEKVEVTNKKIILQPNKYLLAEDIKESKKNVKCEKIKKEKKTLPDEEKNKKKLELNLEKRKKEMSLESEIKKVRSKCRFNGDIKCQCKKCQCVRRNRESAKANQEKKRNAVLQLDFILNDKEQIEKEKAQIMIERNNLKEEKDILSDENNKLKKENNILKDENIRLKQILQSQNSLLEK